MLYYIYTADTQHTFKHNVMHTHNSPVLPASDVAMYAAIRIAPNISTDSALIFQKRSWLFRNCLNLLLCADTF